MEKRQAGAYAGFGSVSLVVGVIVAVISYPRLDLSSGTLEQAGSVPGFIVGIVLTLAGVLSVTAAAVAAGVYLGTQISRSADQRPAAPYQSQPHTPQTP